MKSRSRLWIAGLTAFLLGVPLVEKAAADDTTEEIVFSSISLIMSIVDAATAGS